ncbi:aromatic-L-amino-acid decarboxylase [Phlebotomus papatasi]|uniref:aromatic-L-amino-acid decarboxylase n=1 Tax=Phlebotomus papatasi TaxID=29031 RepID=UPI0024843D32|nr:aromatic-L-amino-acid decarboxylase [Phlebotomus papatasi]XP_055701579.1 aromatic-L-amino-acid decarboxylase [Phlebotomus papatasi]
MDTKDFNKYGKEMIDYICNYMENIETRDVAPKVDPGYLKELVPSEAPQKGEDFKTILGDIESKIMPGVVHWNHPYFFAYFPSGNSYPSILGDVLSSAIGSIGFSWASCPASTELETIVLDWYAKALDLPDFFVSDSPGSKGGGAIQGSASECALVCMISARARAIKELKGNNYEIHDSVYLPQLVAYASREAHSSIEKAAKMAIIKLRILDTDSRGSFRGETLRAAIEKDVKDGLTPFFVVATVGTTGACAFDNLKEIGKVCQNYSNIWFHVDGAYAGNSFILPEMRQFKEGMEYADSFNTNPNKLLLTNFDASALWVRDVMALKTALTVNPLYLQHEHASAIDYRHYGIPLSRRFRSLKLWFVFRSYGITGLQQYIRNHIALAKRFEQLVRSDERFEVRNDVHLGLVCFRLRQSDATNRDLLARINHSGKFHMTPAMVRGKYAIRFCVTYEHAKEEHIDYAWQEIKAFAEEFCEAEHIEKPAPIAAKKPHKKLTRKASARFSFTRSVSREIYERQSSISNLPDGCTPIIVLETDDILKSLQKATRKNLETKYTETDSTDEDKRIIRLKE